MKQARLACLCALGLAGALALAPAASRADDGREDEHEVEDGSEHGPEAGDDAGGGDAGADATPTSTYTGRRGRVENDLRIRMKVRGRRRPALRVRVVVRNRGFSYPGPATVTLRSDGVSGSETLWTRSVSLAPGRRRGWTLRVPRPSGATALVAEVEIDGVEDQRPDDNVFRVWLGGGSLLDPTVGAAIWNSDCASCHGADGRGGTVDDDVAGESWREILEAVREGEDGMPRFPSIGRTEAKSIFAYLRDPDAAAPPDPAPVPDPVPDPAPTPDPTPDPTPTPPTYATDVQAIMARSCTSCHRQGRASAGIRLDTYDTARAGATSSLSSIRARRMPPGGSFPAADEQTLADWIAGGYLR